MKYLISCFFFCAMISLVAQEDNNIYNDLEVSISKSVDSLSIEQVVQKFEKGEFVKENKPTIYKRLEDNAWWYHFKVDSDKETQYFSIANAYLSYGKCYLKTTDSIYALHKVSYFKDYPYQFVFYRHPTWKLPTNLPRGTSVFLELRNNGGRSRLEFHLENENSFLKRATTEYLFFGAYMMFLLSMLIVLVFFAVLKKEYIVLVYASYILLTIIEFLAGKGLGIQYLWSGNSFLTHSIRSFSQLLGTILMGLFYLNFYQLTNNQKWNKNIFKWGIYLITPFVFFYIYKMFFGGFTTLYLYVWITIKIVIIFWLFNHVYLVLKKQIPFYLVIAFVLPILAISTSQSINPSVYSSNFKLIALENIYYVTLVIEILLFTRYIFDSVIKSQLKYIQLKKISDELKYNFQNKTIEIQQKERNYLVSEVHDSFGGYLEALKLRLLNKTNNNPEKIQEILDSFYKDYRYLLNGLHAPKINALNFKETLLEFCEKLNEIAGNTIKCDINLKDKTLAQDKCVHLYRIISELLTNAIKYANASEIILKINQNKDKSINLQVIDDGIGYDKNSIRKNALGLKNIQERIAIIKGTMQIETSKSKGTKVIINLKNE